MISKTDRKILSASPLFDNLGEEEVTECLSALRAKDFHYKKGEYLLMEDESVLYFGLVLSGKILVCQSTPEGEKMIMAAPSRGQTFGESLAYLKTEKSPVYIYADEETRILKMSPACLFAEGNEKIKENFTALLAARTLTQNRRIQILSKLTIRDKLLTYFSQMRKKGNSFEIPLDRENLAYYIGCERSALSRELSKMKKEGILDYKKNKFIFL